MKKLISTCAHPLDEKLSLLVSKTIETLYDVQIEDDLSKLFGDVPNRDQGHRAFPCFSFAKTLKKGPPQIAKEIESKLKASQSEDECPFLDDVKAVGPYLNFFFSPGSILQFLQNQDFFQFKNRNLFSETPKTMLEYSQPNTHKDLHVGHMRNLCLGNALVRIFRYANIETLAATYPGDVGTHVAKCLWFFKTQNQELPKNLDSKEKGSWLGKLYEKANSLLEEQRGSNKEDQNRKELTEILKQIHQGSGEYYDLWKTTREWSLALMNDIYDWADVKFDRWFFESEVDEASLKLVDEYTNKGVFVLDDGAIGCDLSEDKLGFCLLKKRDGNGLYATKDIELARRKFDEFGIELNLYLVDTRQEYHFKQVFKTLEKMGFAQATNCHHLKYDFVELPDGAMSSRKGNVIPLIDLVDLMTAKIKENYLERYRGDWPDMEIDSTAKMIASGAIKYGMCKIDPQKKIVFEMEEWLKLDGNSGPYLQYSYARIQSLLEKNQTDAAADLNTLTSPYELEILLALPKLNAVVQQAILKYDPSLVCHYLYELCQKLNSFYANCSIKNAESEGQKSARLSLIGNTGLVIKQGLELLGIEAPQRM